MAKKDPMTEFELDKEATEAKVAPKAAPKTTAPVKPVVKAVTPSLPHKLPPLRTPSPPPPAPKPELDKTALRREKKKDDTPPPPPKPVAAGPAGVIADALLNPTPEKMLEFTDFDRNQVTLIPTLIVLDDMWGYCQEVATYRNDSQHYLEKYKREKPIANNLINKFVFTLAQCRRSLGGKTQKALEDLALADLESRSDNMEGALGSGSGFEQD